MDEMGREEGKGNRGSKIMETWVVLVVHDACDQLALQSTNQVTY